MSDDITEMSDPKRDPKYNWDSIGQQAQIVELNMYRENTPLRALEERVKGDLESIQKEGPGKDAGLGEKKLFQVGVNDQEKLIREMIAFVPRR